MSAVDKRQRPYHPLRCQPPSVFATQPAPPPPVPAKSPLRVRLLTDKPLPVLLHSPRLTNPLPTSPPNTPSTGPCPNTWIHETSSLVTARCDLIEERSGDPRSAEILNRMDKSTGKILPVPPPPSPAATKFEKQLPDTAYYLRSASRSVQRARVGDPERNKHLLPSSKPLTILRRKLHEGVVEKRRLQRREEEARSGSNGGRHRSQRGMGTLRALMLRGDRQAEREYFQRREEEEQVRRRGALVRIR